MTNILLDIQGKPGKIDARVLTLAFSNFLEYLGDIDRGVSGNPQGTLDWIVSDLRIGSNLHLQVSPVSRNPAVQNGEQVARLAVEGLSRIEAGSASPAYVSVYGMQRARKMVGVIGQYGATGLRVTDFQQEVDMTPQSVSHIAELLRPRRKSLGAVEGVLEMISLHKTPRFTVYSSVTKKAVTCNFVKEQFLDEVKDALGNRVNARGVVYSNGKGEPLFVNVEHIRRLHSWNEFPTDSTLHELVSGATTHD